MAYVFSFYIDGEETALEDMTKDQLQALQDTVTQVINNRIILEGVLEESSLLNRRYLMVRDGAEMTVWKQPQGAFDAYPEGYRVYHDDKMWVSKTPSNVWEPPTGWREITEDGSVPEWTAPTGAHDAYAVGEMVVFAGQVWKSVIDANVHSPSDYPAGWTLVIDDDTPVEEPEPPVEPSVQEWSPTATYKIGDVVQLDGIKYECLVPHGAEYQGTWKPGVAHSVWKNLGPV